MEQENIMTYATVTLDETDQTLVIIDQTQLPAKRVRSTVLKPAVRGVTDWKREASRRSEKVRVSQRGWENSIRPIQMRSCNGSLQMEHCIGCTRSCE